MVKNTRLRWLLLFLTASLLTLFPLSLNAENACPHKDSPSLDAVVPLKEAMGQKDFDKAMASNRYRYVGSSKCRLCHREFFLGRKKDPHDFAFDLLVKIGEDKNPKCLGCHTTGHGVKEGFVSVKETPRLANVQCEGCHGPGNIHMKYGKDKRPVGFLAGTDRPDRLKKMCKTCHTNRWDNGLHIFEAEYKAYKNADPNCAE